jgi:uncharacterized protein YggE
MTRAFAIAAMAMLTGGCLPNNETQRIIVSGVGRISTPPEIFELEGVLRAQATEKTDALGLASTALRRVNDALPLLDGVTEIQIVSSEVNLAPVRDQQCVEDAAYDADDACPIVKYLAEIELTVTGQPASKAGDAFSLLAEIGAEEVELNGYSLVNEDLKHAEAAAAGLADAKRQAQQLAEASGSSLGRPLRITYGAAEHDAGVLYDSLSEDEIVVSARRITPKVALTLSPKPIEVRETVTAEFALENTKP